MNRKQLVPIAAISLLLGASHIALAADTASDKPVSATVGDAISDTAITAKVKAKLMDDTRLKQTDVSVTTANGVVTLTGTSQTSDGKTTAEDITRHVDGVKDVDNQIMTPSIGSTISKDTKSAVKKTEQVTSDSWITTKVKSALLADSITKGFKISVSTTHHVVVMHGTVDSQDTIDKATAIARQIKGVQDVDTSGLKIGNG
jgi:hyperosmotically inducible protein